MLLAFGAFTSIVVPSLNSTTTPPPGKFVVLTTVMDSSRNCSLVPSEKTTVTVPVS